jgi:hypothetical protein
MERHGSKRAVLPMMTMMMMIPENCYLLVWILRSFYHFASSFVWLTHAVSHYEGRA